ncbi:MAG: hypothetical protein BAA02_02950 [Paenibacillaceae bacterium ZCTH02-B3]|nr:MAG: hypothetical protein BAA02_02950 [Paenibacillaceae bacterium ZCTH02-B3]
MERAKAFLEAVATNENLAKALSGIKTREELLAFAASHGHDLTEQDLKDIVKIGSVYLKHKAGEPLSDEELEMVSGGFLVYLIGVGIVAVSAIISAAITTGALLIWDEYN